MLNAKQAARAAYAKVVELSEENMMLRDTISAYRNAEQAKPNSHDPRLTERME